MVCHSQDIGVLIRNILKYMISPWNTIIKIEFWINLFRTILLHLLNSFHIFNSPHKWVKLLIHFFFTHFNPIESSKNLNKFNFLLWKPFDLHILNEISVFFIWEFVHSKKKGGICWAVIIVQKEFIEWIELVQWHEHL